VTVTSAVSAAGSPGPTGGRERTAAVGPAVSEAGGRPDRAASPGAVAVVDDVGDESDDDGIDDGASVAAVSSREVTTHRPAPASRRRAAAPAAIVLVVMRIRAA
jgi:hypothetical protein